MPDERDMFGGSAIDPEAIRRITTDPYMRHLVWLINTGMFPESQQEFKDELMEHMGQLVTEEGLTDVN